jgi:hypothetical protein
MEMENPAVKPGIENTVQKNGYLKFFKMLFTIEYNQ